MNQLEEYFDTIKSEHSKETYEQYFEYFNKWSKMTPVDLLKLPQKKIQDKLIDYVIYMKKNKLAYSTVKGRLSPLIRFCEYNDKSLNKLKIKSHYGEERKTVKDKAYTTADIQTMLSHAKLRVKAMILFYSSTGCRRDAILDLKLKNLDKIEKHGLYKVTVYENSKEEYITYTTPECANMIDQYLKHRQDSGEVINKNIWLFRNDYDFFRKDLASNPKQVVSIAQNTLFRHLLIKSGLRAENEPLYTRHEKTVFHAFRKFFTNQLVEAGVQSECRWLLEGHALLGNDSAYVRITEKQLLEQYLKAVNNLTISDEERLKVENREIKVERSQFEELSEKFNMVLAEVDRLKQGKK